MTTGLDLKLIRIAHELRQVDLARAAGFSRQRLSQLEARRRVSPAIVERITRAAATAAADR